MIHNMDELSQAREMAVQQLNAYDCRILVCSGTGCIATGSNHIHEIFENLVKETPGVELVFSPCGGNHEEAAVGVKKTGCQGFCELGPLVRIQKGEKVTHRRFGGEGTGGNSMRPFPWKEGDVIKTLVVEHEDGPDFRQIAGYIFDPAENKWTLMSCWRIQALSRGLGGGCGFVEDFKRDVVSKGFERRATFGPALRWDGKEWSAATEFRFTRDGNPLKEINCRFDPKRGYFSLATGGTIKEEADFPVFTSKTLPQQPAVVTPDEEIMKLIQRPKLEQVQYNK